MLKDKDVKNKAAKIRSEDKDEEDNATDKSDKLNPVSIKGKFEKALRKAKK